MKWIFVSLFLLILLFVQTVPASAAKKSKSTSSMAVSGQYIRLRNVVRAYFGGLKGVKTVSYTLMYQSDGVGQGVMGGFSPGKKTGISKDIYLGTCSGRICVPHRNIKNMQLEVTTSYSNGKSSSKTVKVK